MNESKSKTLSLILLCVPLILGLGGDGDATSSFLLALVVLLPSAKLAGMAAERLGRRAVLGELEFLLFDPREKRVRVRIRL